jgi:hypothetical protein
MNPTAQRLHSFSSYWPVWCPEPRVLRLHCIAWMLPPDLSLVSGSWAIGRSDTSRTRRISRRSTGASSRLDTAHLDRPQDCVLCGTSERIHLHHTTYERLGRERLADLVPLCHRCHSMVHELIRRGEIGLDLDLRGLTSADRAAAYRDTLAEMLQRAVTENGTLRRITPFDRSQLGPVLKRARGRARFAARMREQEALGYEEWHRQKRAKRQAEGNQRAARERREAEEFARTGPRTFDPHE